MPAMGIVQFPSSSLDAGEMKWDIVQKVQNVIDDQWHEAETPTLMIENTRTHTHLFTPGFV